MKRSRFTATKKIAGESIRSGSAYERLIIAVCCQLIPGKGRVSDRAPDQSEYDEQDDRADHAIDNG